MEQPRIKPEPSKDKGNKQPTTQATNTSPAHPKTLTPLTLTERRNKKPQETTTPDVRPHCHNFHNTTLPNNTKNLQQPNRLRPNEEKEYMGNRERHTRTHAPPPTPGSDLPISN
jgi:hypothetical protein